MPWSDYAHDAQHTALSPCRIATIGHIHWQTPVDLDPQYSGGDLLIHYGSPLITRSNTIIVPVKTGASGGFRVEAHVGTNGALKWMQSTDYVLPPHYWTPSFSPTLTPKNRLYFPAVAGLSTTAIRRIDQYPWHWADRVLWSDQLQRQHKCVSEQCIYRHADYLGPIWQHILWVPGYKLHAVESHERGRPH